MLNLGGSIMGFSSADSSSASKGESVSDTIRTVSCYADIVAMRHQRKERRWLPVSTLPFLSSTQETEDISIQPRH